MAQLADRGRVATPPVPCQNLVMPAIPDVTVPPDVAARLVRTALGNVTSEYPNKLDHVLTGPGDLLTPRTLHPIFFGSFDWHSCVHAYWLLARLLRTHPALPEAETIRALFNASFSAQNVAGEVAYLGRPSGGTFERPYGWAWLLMLTAELSRHAGCPWSTALQPLGAAFAQRFRAFLPKATYPIRAGTHANTAFALALVSEYARECHDEALLGMVMETARRWYRDDVDCPAWEPGGEDFLSPCLIEAECMRRLLPTGEFRAWFDRFLPRIEQRMPRTLFKPVEVSDRTDGKIAHLDGLNLSRAWCWGNLAECAGYSEIMQEAALCHLQASLPHITGDYMGEHWLATFALLAIEGVGAVATQAATQ